jgi:hypothetical protein
VSRGARINGRVAAVAGQVLRHVRCDVDLARRGNKPGRVIGLVGPDGSGFGPGQFGEPAYISLNRSSSRFSAPLTVRWTGRSG